MAVHGANGRLITAEQIAEIAMIDIAEARCRLQRLVELGYLVRLGSVSGWECYGPTGKGDEWWNANKDMILH
jgi:hypothetical protein